MKLDDWYEEEIEASDNAGEEIARGKADAIDDAIDRQYERDKATQYMRGSWDKLGGDVDTGEYRFEVNDNCVMILKKDPAGDKCVAMVYNPFDAWRIAEIMRMHVPLVRSLDAAMNVVRTLDSNKTPQTQKFYIETNLLLEMLKAKEAKTGKVP